MDSPLREGAERSSGADSSLSLGEGVRRSPPALSQGEREPAAPVGDRLSAGSPERSEEEGTTFALRLGLKEVHGLGEAARAVIERERARGPFRSIEDFVTRTGFDRETLERLAEVGAFVESFGRRAAIWATGELAGFGERHLPGLAGQLAEAASLPPMTDWEETQADYRGLGYSLGRHVVSFFRPRLDQMRALSAADLPRKARRGLVVRAGGLVIVRQRPETASNLLFMTLEDETGLFNAVVYPATYERYRRVLRGESLLVLEGPAQVKDDVLHILVRRAWPLVTQATVARVPSHDFH